MSYTIKLPHFEGPFDLLLFFIERDELDIYNIPIAQITNEFLDYIHTMEKLSIDIASEFILVASTLMRIKAKMLLPRREIDEQGNEVDPRQELVHRLMEYKQFKDIIDDLKVLEAQRQEKTTRGNVNTELKKLANKALIDTELESLSLFKLLKTFERVLKRMEEANKEKKHTVITYNFTVKEEQQSILTIVNQLKKASCLQVFEGCSSKIHAIFRFLAMLELIQLQKVSLVIREGFNNFWLE
jgi:segregation and condensation protein A